MKAPSKEQMIAKKVQRGGHPVEAELFLEEIIQAHEGYNLAYALHYWGYAGEKAAHAFAGIEL